MIDEMVTNKLAEKKRRNALKTEADFVFKSILLASQKKLSRVVTCFLPSLVTLVIFHILLEM